MIKYAKNMSIVLILGGFRKMMSYCGSIGTLMGVSGFSKAHKTCYEDVTVNRIASGKAMSKALRTHFLTGEGIMTLLLMNPFFPHSEGAETNQERINELSSGEITSFNGDIKDRSVDIGKIDALDQDLDSPTV